MCGIVGVLSSRPPSTRAPLARMCDVLCHRGPDGDGQWWSPDGRVGLGHRRLAIIDLSTDANQPMHAVGGGLHLVFNGEIYNYLELRAELAGLGHQFRTVSDTEVLLEGYRAWGLDFLGRLNGMFALALYDAERGRVVIARDRAGEKPLFYTHAGGELRFASELKALMADPRAPRRVDMAALEEYLAFGYVSAPASLLQGVRKLPAGHFMTYDLTRDELRVERYWRLPTPLGIEVDDEALVDELESLLADSVRRQLVADVPVGVLLSGGIDSSLVTALAARVSGRRVRTFTITFPGHGDYDEGPFARLVADHFGTEHTELVAEPATADLLPRLARQFDEPMADSSMVPTYLVARLIREHATVALGGDGGDELFGGYMHYSRLLEQSRLRSRIPAVVRRLAGGMAGRLPVGTRGRNFVLTLSGDDVHGIVQQSLYFDADARRALLAAPAREALGAAGGPERARAALARGHGSALQAATAVDFETYLSEDILAKVDRASMLASLEIRAPFLDHRLVEFAFAKVPDRLRATRDARKILPRRLARRLLPPALDLTRKQGFALPLTAWFSGPWGSYMADVLREAPPGLFDAAAVSALVEGQRRGRSNTQRIFALTMFELWRREYDVALPT